MPDRYYAAACQTSFDCPRRRDEIGQRVTHMIGMVEGALAGYEPFFDLRLFVFPEFAHAAPTYLTVEELDRHLAVELPNEHTDRYAALAKRHGIWIQTGSFIERRPGFPGHVFNTTALVGPEGVLSLYRKVNPWIPWEVHASPHDLPGWDAPLFPVVDTAIGRLGTAICYDWLFPETIRELAFQGCEVAIRVSAYMDPWGSTPPMDWWTLFNRARAAENTLYVVASNQAATIEGYPPFGWPGSSMVVDFDGRILAQAEAGPHEKIVVAPIDVAALRAERARRAGHDTRSHFRSEAYRYARTPHFPPADAAPISIASLGERIATSQRAEGGRR